MLTTAPSPLSLERIIPDALDANDATGQETYALHLARYRFAARFVRSGPVLDCACGVGYGSAVLAQAPARSERVLGVDIDERAVAHASKRYADDRLRFRAGDGCVLTDPQGFETIVSLETVEHVPDPACLLANFERLLLPGGTLVASVPVTPSVDVNPYHLHDFTARSFRAMGTALGLTEVDTLRQDQPFSPFRIAAGREARLADMRPGLLGYYLTHPGRAATRLRSTLIDGFKNKYLTIAWRKAS